MVNPRIPKSKDDEVNVLETCNSHKTRELSCRNGDGRASHETTDGGGWDELDEPTDSEQTHAEGDKPADERKSSGDCMRLPSVSVSVDDVLDDFRYGEGHDSDWTNRHILGGGEELR